MIEIIKADISYLDPEYDIVRKSSDWIKREYKFTHWDSWYTKARIKENFIKGEVYVLLKDNIPVATYTIKKSNPSYYSKENIDKFSNPKAEAYYCYTLAVLPKYHGNGFAKELLSHLEKTAKENNIKYLRFDAKADYTQLIEFYKKRGFIIVGELNDEGELYYLFEKTV
jgi:ribosomal protein S18 acetylase RimI-like enzyme